jgi:hypothetical protein
MRRRSSRIGATIYAGEIAPATRDARISTHRLDTALQRGGGVRTGLYQLSADERG